MRLPDLMPQLGPTDEVVAVWRESLASGRDPLHNLVPEEPGAWYACSAPERPVDDLTCFDYRCRPCWLMAEAAVRENPFREVEATEDDYVVTNPGGHVAAWIDSHRFAVRCAERIAAAEHGSFRLTGDRGNTDRPKGGT